MVGTVFINSLSSSLVGVDLSLQNDVIDEVCGRFCTLLRQLIKGGNANTMQELLLQFIAYADDLHLISQGSPGHSSGDPRVVDFLESFPSCCFSAMICISFYRSSAHPCCLPFFFF